MPFDTVLSRAQINGLRKAELERMLAKKVIERDRPEWTSPTVLVTIKVGSLCFLVDYQNLNGVKVQHLSSLPRVNKCIDFLEDPTVFSSIYANCIYLKIEFAEADRHQTTSIYHHGLCGFIGVSFGSKNGPRTF